MQKYLYEKFKPKDNSLLTLYLHVLKHYKAEKESSLDIIALGALLGGDLLNEIKNGRWALVKRYGIYNPYYEPIIVDDELLIYNVYDALYSAIKWKHKNLDSTIWLLKFKDLKNTTAIYERDNIQYSILES